MKYSLLVWLACAPLFYLFGLPYLLAKLEVKARAESYTKCQQHLTEENLANVSTGILSPQKAEEYCHCVSNPIRFTRADLVDLARHRTPQALNATLQPAVAACNAGLQQVINERINAGPKPRSTWDEHGVETVHFD